MDGREEKTPGNRNPFWGETLRWLRNPFRTTQQAMKTIVYWYLQGNRHSGVSQVVQDFVHPQYVNTQPLGTLI